MKFRRGGHGICLTRRTTLDYMYGFRNSKLHDHVKLVPLFLSVHIQLNCNLCLKFFMDTICGSKIACLFKSFKYLEMESANKGVDYFSLFFCAYVFDDKSIGLDL